MNQFVGKQKDVTMTTLSLDSGSSNQNEAEGLLTSAAQQNSQKQTIAITATFTAELVEESLTHWMQELALPSTINFATYNHLCQQLFDPSSLLSKNQRALNVNLLLLEDS